MARHFCSKNVLNHMFTIVATDVSLGEVGINVKGLSAISDVKKNSLAFIAFHDAVAKKVRVIIDAVHLSNESGSV